MNGNTDCGNEDPWEQAARRTDEDTRAEEAAQRVAEEIAAVVAHARDAGIDDETIMTQLQDATDALREGLT